MSTYRRRAAARPALLGAALAAVLVAGACGSTRSDADLRAQFRTRSEPAPAGQSASVPDATPTEAGTAATAAAPEVQPEAQAASGSVAAAVSSKGTGPSPAATDSVAASGSSAPASKASAGASASPASGGSPKPAPAPAAPGGVPAPKPPQSPAAGGPQTEIVLGSLGTESGVLGGLFAPIVQGARAWTADVNARGGLNGHPVRVIYADDAGDPNRAVAQARRLVEQEHAIAFYADHAVITMPAIRSYVEQHRIPIIGGCNCSQDSQLNTMVFYVGTGSAESFFWAHLLPMKTFHPEIKKVSVLWCREVSQCKFVRDGVHKLAAKAGVEVVHDSQVSLAQPDFTAEVIAARNAGAEAIIGATENNSIIRIARSAHRQGFNPVMVGQWSAHDTRFLKDGGADVEGAVLNGASLHWDSPALADYRTALAKYVPGGILGSFSALSWTAGKLLESIAPTLPANPTNEDVLRGLYAVNGDTLGGLSLPLHFVPNASNADNYACVIPLTIRQGRFVAKDGDNWACAPGWKPPGQ
jgi:branched-chain amino acid transport system substrate-binding protein